MHESRSYYTLPFLSSGLLVSLNMAAPIRGEIPPQSNTSNDGQTTRREGEVEPVTAAQLLTDQTRYVSVKKIIMVRLFFDTTKCPADVSA